MEVHQGAELHEARVEALAYAGGIVVGVLQMAEERGLVLLLLAARGAHGMHALHVLDELVGHLEDLLAVVARQEVARSLVLATVNPQIKLLAEGNLTLGALELAATLAVGRDVRGKVLVLDVVLDDGEVVRAERALVAVVAMREVVVVDQAVQLVLRGRHGGLVDQELAGLGLLPLGARLRAADVTTAATSRARAQARVGRHVVSRQRGQALRRVCRGRRHRGQEVEAVRGRRAVGVRAHRVDGLDGVGASLLQPKSTEDTMLHGLFCRGCRASSSVGSGLGTIRGRQEAVPLLLLIDLCRLNVALSLLMLLQVGLLAEEHSARCALEWSDPLVDALVHISVAGTSEDL